MPEVTLRDKSSLVNAVVLTLARGSGPQLELTLPTDHKWNLERGDQVMQLLGERATFQWEECSLSFRVTGFRSTPGGRDAIVGMVLSDDTLDWFEGRRVVAGSSSMLVYQRQEADSDGWAFLRRVLGNQFGVPHGSSALDAALPVGTCFCRPARLDNLSHQERILGLLAHMPTRAWGWCAFDVEGGDPPLRILGLDAPPFEIPSAWAPPDIGEVHLPHRIAGAAREIEQRSIQLERTFAELTHESAGQVVRELTRAGVEGALDSILEAGAEIPCLPSQVKIGNMVSLCPVLRYSFDLRQSAPDAEVQMKARLTIEPLPVVGGGTPMVFSGTGAFVEWDEASKKQRIALKTPDEQWLMMGDGGKQGNESDVETPDAQKPLICDALTPYAARAEFAGFYVSHKQDDPLVFQIRDGEVPHMIGMKQQCYDGLEEVDLVLNSKTVSISGLGTDAPIATADGIAVDGQAGTVEVFAEKEVAIKKKITITDDASNFDHNLQVSKSAEISGDTKIVGKVEIESETKIAKTLDVGG